MYYIKLKLIALFFICFGYNIHAQIMYVRSTNDVQTDYSLVHSTSLVFNSGNMLVSQSNGNSDSYVLSEIRYVNFKDLTIIGVSEVDNSNHKLVLFPNPVNDIVNLQIQNEQYKVINVELISIDGRVVYKEKLENGNSIYKISVANFPKGIYICKVIYGSRVETIKFIKQ
jgi:hypothetical protein